MSCAVASSYSSISTSVTPRKRTMSFSTPTPNKASRTLRRTGSYLSLADMEAAIETPLYGHNGATSCSRTSDIPYTRTLRYYKELRDRRRGTYARSPTIVIQTTPAPLPPSSAPVYTARLTMPRPRTSSPLAPARTILPARASFPRSKPEPNLYRMAITTRMRMSPEGQKILNMGPRLAISIYTATKELEQIVAAQRDSDRDVAMSNADSPLSNSWVVVPPEDWEMVDCTA
ncbi:hypothetical protein A0H81_07845 [Grifola frondosa]|uniref:Uncharacterized protein n=1 Tax=Grifola frondosa TaxID=5627 RepID=A0A1C7M611_GRIFR|nr:hypothetical protein A0H81_07845 [Grifola frondosa]